MFLTILPEIMIYVLLVIIIIRNIKFDFHRTKKIGIICNFILYFTVSAILRRCENVYEVVTFILFMLNAFYFFPYVIQYRKNKDNVEVLRTMLVEGLVLALLNAVCMFIIRYQNVIKGLLGH